jgi:hypothetical protein
VDGHVFALPQARHFTCNIYGLMWSFTCTRCGLLPALDVVFYLQYLWIDVVFYLQYLWIDVVFYLHASGLLPAPSPMKKGGLTVF